MYTLEGHTGRVDNKNGANARKIERYAHKSLNAHRMSGEWFTVEKEKAIKTVQALFHAIEEEGQAALSAIDAINKKEQAIATAIQSASAKLLQSKRTPP